jgi:hypothetical protein
MGQLRQEGLGAGSVSAQSGLTAKQIAHAPKRSSRYFRGCVLLVVWSVLLLAVGFLAAAVLVDLEGSGPAVLDGSSDALFDEADIGILAGVARRYTM